MRRLLSHEEPLAVIGARDRHDAAEPPDHETGFRVEILLVVHHHPDAGEHQKGAEQVDDPVEVLNQVRAGRDHRAAHQQGAEDAPEEDAVLVAGGHPEGAEDQDEDEDVVDGQRLLDQVAGEVFQPGVPAHESVDARAEQQRQSNPDETPRRRFTSADLVRLLVKDEEVDREHRDDEGIECDPQPQLVHRYAPSGALMRARVRQWHEALQTKKGETLATGLFAARAKVSPFPMEPDRTVRRSAVLTIRRRGAAAA